MKPRCNASSAVRDEQRDSIVQVYLTVLDRPGCCDTVRAGLDSASDFFVWFAGNVAARLQLCALADLTEGEDR
jgi:hypothetical protein